MSPDGTSMTERVATMSTAPADDRLDAVVEEARDSLRELQRDDGHWVFELEADATIPAEYIMLEHFLDEIDPEVEAKLAVYLRRIQGRHGGWPLFYDGAFDLSATVKAYYALKLVGDDIEAPHMQRARDAILARGGAARANVFTRIALALFGQVPWRAVPVMPVEIMLLPRWFPFHLSKVSYWSRTVIVPLLVLMALKPRARNPRGRRTSASCSRRRPRTSSTIWSTRPASRSAAPFSRSTGCCAGPSRCSRPGRAGAPSSARSRSGPSGSTARTGWAASSRPWPIRSWPMTRSAMRRTTPIS